MAFGVCYTQSGNVKRYEPEQLVNVPGSITYVTCYTVGYPSTAYYPDSFRIYFNVKLYPDIWGPPVPNYEPGMVNYAVIGTSPNDNTYNKIYNLMSYTPPDGYVLDENGNYTYTAQARLYTYNYDVQYGNVIKPWFSGQYIEKKFKYKKKESKVYVSLSCSNDIFLNNVVYHPYNSTEQTIYTIDMPSIGDNYIDIVIGLSSKYSRGSFYLIFKDSNGNSIARKKYQDINLVVDNDLSFPVDDQNSRCIISKYSDTLVDAGYIFCSMDGIGYTFDSSGWSNNTLYTPKDWNIIGGAPGPSNAKISHYQSSFKITLDGYTKTIWLTTKIQNIRHFG